VPRTLPIMQQQGKTDVFIVRIWKEPRDASHRAALWRGTVEHVASKAMRHIDHLAELVEFIETTAGLAKDRSDRS
jgi:hypothetical protein